MSETESVLDQDATRFVDMIDGLGLANSETRYTIMAPDEYEHILKNDPSKGSEIYWREMLARAHLTALTGILRSRRWLSAVVSATRDKNLLAFASAFRGLIESAADTSSALRGIPLTLAHFHSQIIAALSGELDKTICSSSEMEDALIHFSHARHLSKAERKKAPPSHKVRSVREYMQILEKGQVTKVDECYSVLCDLTHPGASSVWMWLNSVDGTEIILSAHQDESIISRFLQQYRTMMVELLMFAFNPAIITLNILNYFPIREFHTPELLNWNLSGIALWQKCQSELKGAHLQV